jgi:hypothetical protein
MKWGICYFLTHPAKKMTIRELIWRIRQNFYVCDLKTFSGPPKFPAWVYFLPCSVKVHRLGLQHTAFP